MDTKSVNKIDQHFLLVAAPILTMFIMAVALGFFAFVLDPRLQGFLPLADWPLPAKAIHYIAPWLAVGAAFFAGGLCVNSLGEKVLKGLTKRPAVIAALVVAMITIILVGHSSFAIVDAFLVK